jgi:hypothetical protein
MIYLLCFIMAMKSAAPPYWISSTPWEANMNVKQLFILGASTLASSACGLSVAQEMQTALSSYGQEGQEVIQISALHFMASAHKSMRIIAASRNGGHALDHGQAAR